MKYLKVAVIQPNVKVNEYQTNLDHAAEMIRKCTEEGAKLVCLPEAFATSLNLPRVKELAQTTDGEICTFLRDMAKECGVYLIGGFIEKEEDNIYSSSVCIDPEGTILGKYQRRYIYALEKHFLAAGKKSCLIETEIGKIGLIMGYDINFPEACRDLFKEGVEIIVSPTQIPKVYYQSTRQLAVARATENNCYFILASSCGMNTIARLVYMGGSLAAHSSTGLEDYSTQYSQQEDILGSCEYNEGYFIAKLNMTKIRREIEDSTFFDDFMRNQEV